MWGEQAISVTSPKRKKKREKIETLFWSFSVIFHPIKKPSSLHWLPTPHTYLSSLSLSLSSLIFLKKKKKKSPFFIFQFSNPLLPLKGYEVFLSVPSHRSSSWCMGLQGPPGRPLENRRLDCSRHDSRSRFNTSLYYYYCIMIVIFITVRICMYIIFSGGEAVERLTTLGIAVNLVTYMTATMHLGNATSANTVTNFLGTSFMLCLLGGFIADTFLGR